MVTAPLTFNSPVPPGTEMGVQALPGNIFLVSEFIYINDENLKEKPHLLPGKLEYTVNSYILKISKNYLGIF